MSLKKYYRFREVMQKILITLIALTTLSSCSLESAEKFAIQKAMEIILVDLCGEEDKECIQAVEEQVSPCLEKQNWRRMLDVDITDEESDMLAKTMANCIVDEDGEPYFAI